MTNVTHKFLSMYLFLFITLYMFRAHRAHHQERQIASIQPLVTVFLCWWPRCVQVGSRVTVSSGCIDTICPSWWWERCARNMYRVKNKNKYIERNLCVTLVIYQEATTLLNNIDVPTKFTYRHSCLICIMRLIHEWTLWNYMLTLTVSQELLVVSFDRK